MSAGAVLHFHLPEGWTLRKVVTAMVQEWLPPFRAEPAIKAAKWVVQSVMEGADKLDVPLWEPGISTAEYEERVDRAGLPWAIRATAGRSKGIVLARFAVNKEHPGVLQFISAQNPLPETLFDAGKLNEFLGSQGASGPDGFFAALLTQHGFKPAN